MATVLIVEDDLNTAEVLKSVILDEFPGWTVEITGTVSDATGILSERRFDFAILDFYLPDDDATKGDLSICMAIRARRQPTRVIHITAGIGDAVFEQHVRDVHVSWIDDPSDFAVLKNDSVNGNIEWMREVISRLKRFLHSDRIEAKLDGLFPEQGDVPESRQQQRPQALGGSVSNRLLDLCADARVHWPYLRNSTRQHLEQHLCVNTSDPGNVRISLIGSSCDA
jgi:CheY-like chemotaxis protein